MCRPRPPLLGNQVQALVVRARVETELKPRNQFLNTMTRHRRRNRQAVRKLLEELSSVLDAFGWYGIGGRRASANDASEPSLADAEDEESYRDDGGDQDYEEEGYDEEVWFYDPWDVQSALDEAMSNILKSDLIIELTSVKEAPSFSETAAVLFGESHELTKRAEYFEKLISGYEDRVSKDDLSEAYDVLRTLMEELGWKETSE